MIILKIMVSIWAVSSILLSIFLFVSYASNRLIGLKKSDLLWMQLISPYLVMYICVLGFKEVITIIKKRRLKRNGNNA